MESAREHRLHLQVQQEKMRREIQLPLGRAAGKKCPGPVRTQHQCHVQEEVSDKGSFAVTGLISQGPRSKSQSDKIRFTDLMQ